MNNKINNYRHLAGLSVRVTAATTERGRQFMNLIGQVGRVFGNGCTLVRVDFDGCQSYTFDLSEVEFIHGNSH